MTREELLEGILNGLYDQQRLEQCPHLSDNELPGIVFEGKRNTPVLLLTLTNGQSFEVRAKALSKASVVREP
ncbi:MAG: hypothetical protein ACYC9L_05600 [Sulfuricaulis sp.]